MPTAIAPRSWPRRVLPCSDSSPHRRQQLVAARLAVALVLGRVDRLGLLDDLARQLLVVQVLIARRVGMHLRAVDGDHPDLREPAARAQREHLTEQTGDRLLVALDEPRERRVVRALLGSQHTKRDVFLAGTLNQREDRIPRA